MNLHQQSWYRYSTWNFGAESHRVALLPDAIPNISLPDRSILDDRPAPAVTP
jgi:hypothetical protein